MCTFHEKGRMVQRMELQIQMTELRGIENYSQALKPCLLLFFFLIYLFIWLCWVFVAAHGLSLIAASKGYSSLWCAGFSLWWLLLLQSTGSRYAGFSSCSMRAQWLWLVGSRAQAQ